MISLGMLRTGEQRGMSCLILLLSGHKAVPVKPWLKTTPHLLKMWNNTQNKRPGGDAVGLPEACSGHPLAVSSFYKFSATSAPVKAEASFSFS